MLYNNIHLLFTALQR